MNIYIWLGIIVFITVVIEGFTEKDILAGMLVGLLFVVAGLFIIGFATTYINENINYDSVEKGLKLVVNSDITNNEIDCEIRNLINSSTNNKGFDILIKTTDNNTSNLMVKKVEIKFKYPILTKYIFKNEKKSFTILIKNDNLQKNIIDITEVK